jgi:hypothetical protein
MAQSTLTMRPQFVTLNRHIVVYRAFVVWGYAAWLARRVLLDMLLRDDDGAWHLSHRTARRHIPLCERNEECEKKHTLVPSGRRMVRQIDLSSRTVMSSSRSLSMTLTVFQLISSLAGKGWYVTFISSFSTPGMSNLAVTCCAQKGRLKTRFR